MANTINSLMNHCKILAQPYKSWQLQAFELSVMTLTKYLPNFVLSHLQSLLISKIYEI